MNSDNEAPHQPDTFQQSPLMKKKNNLLWIGFFILLIILHLPFGWILAYIVPRNPNFTHFYILMLAPLFSPLLIIDFIAFMLVNKETPPWKACFILIFVFNILFFSEAAYVMSGYMGAMYGIVVFPLAALLVITDLIALLSYHYS